MTSIKRTCSCKQNKACEHYNLELLYPELCKEWDYEKNIDVEPSEITPGTAKKIFWICSLNPCGCHKWDTSVKNRTKEKNGTGCPYCINRKVCPHNNLLILHPELCKEWDYEQNELPPETYSENSQKKVSWVCSKNEICQCHKWDANINYRTKIDATGCPFCNKGKICAHNNLLALHPKLCKEWDYEKNIIDPSTIAAGSDKKVFWVCESEKNWCGCHKWEATIDKRAGKFKRGCPYCCNHKLCPHNNLLALYPKLCEEWDYEKNVLGPENFAPFSDKKVFWICSLNPCGCHKWDTSINQRTSTKETNCPYCCNRQLCPHNNLSIVCADLCENEWDYKKNTLGPENFPKGSGEKVWWKCERGHSWRSVIHNRSRVNSCGCPTCCDNTLFSKKQIDWLDKIAKKYKIKIQNALSFDGEYCVNINDKIFRLDGFALVNNKKIAFEFDGCFWHGCEDCFEPMDKNRVNGKTYKKLQDATKQKKMLLEQENYILISIKECEYDNDEDFCEYDDILLCK